MKGVYKVLVLVLMLLCLGGTVQASIVEEVGGVFIHSELGEFAYAGAEPTDRPRLRGAELG